MTLRRRREVVVACLTALGLACLAACGDEPSQAPPGAETEARTKAGSRPHRVVLVVLDTLRADHLEIYGYSKPTAPHLARLAARGTVFDRAHSTSSWTAPSTSSLMTGLYPVRHGVIEGHFAWRERQGARARPLARLPDDVPLLAERFAAAGYRTFAATTNINIGTKIGFDRGFERFVHERARPADAMLTEVAGWAPLGPGQPDPTLLYLHINDAHSPYEPRAPWYEPKPKGRQRRIAAYDSEISYIDHHLAQLAKRLAWDEDTLIVVVSDHGESFGDHGIRQHQGGLHEELTRVAMIFHGPGVPTGRIGIDVSLVDVLPTLLELCGIDVGGEPRDGIDGRSLVPLIRGDAADSPDPRPLLLHRAKVRHDWGGHWWGVVRDGWKLIDDDGARSLYHQRVDRNERYDLATAEPDRAEALAAELQRLRLRGTRHAGERTEIELDAAMLEALDELGYLATDPVVETEDTRRTAVPDAEGTPRTDVPDQNEATRANERGAP